MAKTLELKVETRTAVGKEAAHAIRHTGAIPGIYYGYNKESVKFTVDRRELETTLRQRPRIVHLFTQDADLGECVVRELQKDPVSDELQHVDFLALHPKLKVSITVPLEFSGVPACLKLGGKMNVMHHRLRIRCLPEYLPDALTLDVSAMEADSAILVRDLDFKNIEVREPSDATIVRISMPKAEE
ncbi:MAG: 50S ribosomal protein L25 [Candidatus Delongbacteria bacterium]|nr:50S ribosomal protein L25 [Candidatus Delongbacteria bacterium]